jgi:hypothetical protein
MSHFCDVDVLVPCIDEQGLVTTRVLATTGRVSKETKFGMRVWCCFVPRSGHSVLAPLIHRALPPFGTDVDNPTKLQQPPHNLDDRNEHDAG